MNHIGIHHLVSAEKHLEKSLSDITNPGIRVMVDQAYAIIYEAANMMTPDIADEYRKEKVDPMM